MLVQTCKQANKQVVEQKRPSELLRRSLSNILLLTSYFALRFSQTGDNQVDLSFRQRTFSFPACSFEQGSQWFEFSVAEAEIIEQEFLTLAQTDWFSLHSFRVIGSSQIRQRHVAASSSFSGSTYTPRLKDFHPLSMADR